MSLRALLISLGLSLSACVPDVCARANALSTDFPKDHAACFAAGTLPGPAFDAKACDGSMGSCSAADEQALQTYFGCVEQLPTCTVETKAAFTDAFLSCAAGMNQLSAGCFRP